MIITFDQFAQLLKSTHAIEVDGYYANYIGLDYPNDIEIWYGDDNSLEIYRDDCEIYITQDGEIYISCYYEECNDPEGHSDNIIYRKGIDRYTIKLLTAISALELANKIL